MRFTDVISLAALLVVLSLMVHAAWDGPLKPVARLFRTDPAVAGYVEAVARLEAQRSAPPREAVVSLAVATTRPQR